MKFARPVAVLAGLTLLAAFGCQDNKPAAQSASLNTIAPEPAANAAIPANYSEPAPMAAPVSTVTPADSAPIVMANDVSSPSSGGKYTIKPGDTLYRIAATHYGSGKSWKKIAEANPGVNPSHLRVGQSITLP